MLLFFVEDFNKLLQRTQVREIKMNQLNSEVNATYKNDTILQLIQNNKYTERQPSSNIKNCSPWNSLDAKLVGGRHLTGKTLHLIETAWPTRRRNVPPLVQQREKKISKLHPYKTIKLEYPEVLWIAAHCTSTRI